VVQVNDNVFDKLNEFNEKFAMVRWSICEENVHFLVVCLAVLN
jgi:hypothetical protein